ncbi:MAG: hypothetical protein Q7R52_00745 [archaeon]|nr:hypothetical protein [archaeon]
METLDKAMDMEIATFWAYHIENPCGTIVDGKKVDIRDFYLREARNVLPILTNPFAIEHLENAINKYN